jgi:hypothetical protein
MCNWEQDGVLTSIQLWAETSDAAIENAMMNFIIAVLSRVG